MGSTVLVVDDSAEAIAMLREALTREGFRVIEARDGVECLAQVAAHAPDIVVLDLGMPVMGGLEVLRNLRANRATRNLPVVVLTGETAHATMVEAWLSGAERFLTKPASAAMLIDAVRRLLAPTAGE